MDIEITTIEKNDIWKLRNLPTEAKKVGVKWVYKTKLNENGDMEKYKSCLVAKGYNKKNMVWTTQMFLHLYYVSRQFDW